MPGAMVPNAMNRCHKLTGGAIKGTSREQGTGSGSDDSGTWKRLNKVEVKVEPEAMRKKKKHKNGKLGMVTMVGVEGDVSRREERKGKV